jgi:hypothetical protein
MEGHIYITPQCSPGCDAVQPGVGGEEPFGRTFEFEVTAATVHGAIVQKTTIYTNTAKKTSNIIKATFNLRFSEW